MQFIEGLFRRAHNIFIAIFLIFRACFLIEILEHL